MGYEKPHRCLKEKHKNIKNMTENSEEEENGKWICTMYEEGKIFYW